ncbi:MAG: hypothetical protein QM831_41125 [Kofleriaceae bacterium]
MKALVILVALVGVAHANDFPPGAAYLHEELTLLDHTSDAGDNSEIRQIGLAGFRLHGFIRCECMPIAYHAGLDLALGAVLGRHGGFAYEVGFLPIGVGFFLGRSSWLTIGTGIVGSGATGSLDDAAQWPVDVDLELELTKRIRVIAWGRMAWDTAAPSRVGGSPTIPFADEVSGMIGIRIGHHYEDYGFPTGNGPYLGFSYREMLGTKFIGITLGYSIDMASPPENDRRRHEPV